MRPLLACSALLAACALAACGAVATPTALPAQTLRIVGPAETMPLVREIAESFAAARPGVTVEFADAAPADSVAAVVRGDASLTVITGQPGSMSTALATFEIARQPISVIVNHDNSVRALSLDALGAIYAGRASDWGQVDAAAMPIMPLAREPGAGIRMRWDEVVLGAGSRLTPNALLLPSDEAMIASVARRPEAIGYISGSASLTTVRTLTVNGESPAGIVRGRAYPLWQSITLVCSAPPPSMVSSFLAYVKSKQGQRIIASLGYGQGGDTQ